MQSKILGNTGLVVSRLGLGLAALGRPGSINLGHTADLQSTYDLLTMEKRAHNVLDAAWQRGVRYFDVARSYGQAEAFLASWLAARQIPPGAVTMGSKWGYTYTAGWKIEAEKHEVKDHGIANLVRQAAESREILGSYLSLYQIHSATLESGVLENKEVLEELAQLRATGCAIGLTLTGPHQSATLKRALDVFVAGERLFDAVQATWNLLEPSVGPMLEKAHAAGVGVIVKEALANGRLTERNQDGAFAAQRKVLEEVATRLETTVDAVALAAALDQAWVDVVLSGAATVEQLHSNLAAATVQWDRELGTLLRALVESPEDYWKTRARLPWN
jgi:aryl-alcohol dehydrogenase-like predicted oxidoreductase